MSLRTGVLALTMSLALCGAAGSQAPTFGRIGLDTLKWSGRPGGVQIAAIEGDAMAADRPYTIALRIGNGIWIQPHWHPKTQHLVVVEGTLLLGNGDAIDSASALVLPPGNVAAIPAEAHHYEGGRGQTTIILHGIGPMTTTLVRPRGAGETFSVPFDAAAPRGIRD